VGWKKRKRSRRKRMDSEVNLNPRSSSRRNSNLWIDENDGQGQPVEGTRTHTAASSLSLRLPGSTNSTSNDGAGFPNAMYVKQHNDILKEMKTKSTLFLNERAEFKDGGTRSDHESRGEHTRGDRERFKTRDNTRAMAMARVHKGQQDRPLSQTLPRNLHSSNMTDARLSHRLIHLQPATTSTFKRRTGQKKHARQNINEYTSTHSDTYPDTYRDAYTSITDGGNQSRVQSVNTATNCDILEMEVDTCESVGFDMNQASTTGLSLGVDEADVNPFNYQSNPMDRDSPALAGGLELSENVYVLGPHVNNNPLPPAPLMNRHDFDNYDVTTFSQYAFSTL
jgi:hypothetical protein